MMLYCPALVKGSLQMCNLKKKLSAMMFMESFIFGAWFVPLWQFLSSNGFTPSQIAWSYACTAIASLISPLIIGAIADRFFSAQKILSILMFAGTALMLLASHRQISQHFSSC